MHIVGQFENTVQFGFINVTSNGWWYMFHTVVSSSGVWQEVSSSGGGGWESIESIIFDSRDNAIVVGSYSAEFSLGQDTLVDRDSNGDKRDVFVAQFDSDNQWLWAISAGGLGDDKGVSVQFGSNESPIIGMDCLLYTSPSPRD